MRNPLEVVSFLIIALHRSQLLVVCVPERANVVTVMAVASVPTTCVPPPVVLVVAMVDALHVVVLAIQARYTKIASRRKELCATIRRQNILVIDDVTTSGSTLNDVLVSFVFLMRTTK